MILVVFSHLNDSDSLQCSVLFAFKMYLFCTHRTLGTSFWFLRALEMTSGHFHVSSHVSAVLESCSTPQSEDSCSLLPINCSDVLINSWSEQTPGNHLQFSSVDTMWAMMHQLSKGQGDLNWTLNLFSSILKNPGAFQQMQIRSISYIAKSTVTFYCSHILS